MVNGPLGGNMGTPPVEPQPPQVSFTTTAESRGGFNNFLKSIPQTTNMTPIPPLGSAPTAPMSNPMGNIDIFNQPPSMGMGMMGMNQPQMQQPMQPPMQQPMNMGVGLMGTPIQNFLMVVKLMILVIFHLRVILVWGIQKIVQNLITSKMLWINL